MHEKISREVLRERSSQFVQNFYIILFWCIIPRLFSMLYGERFESADDQKKIDWKQCLPREFCFCRNTFQNPDIRENKRFSLLTDNRPKTFWVYKSWNVYKIYLFYQKCSWSQSFLLGTITEIGIFWAKEKQRISVLVFGKNKYFQCANGFCWRTGKNFLHRNKNDTGGTIELAKLGYCYSRTK